MKRPSINYLRSLAEILDKYNLSSIAVEGGQITRDASDNHIVWDDDEMNAEEDEEGESQVQNPNDYGEGKKTQNQGPNLETAAGLEELLDNTEEISDEDLLYWSSNT